MSENVVDFVPPGLNPPEQENVPQRELTRGERLVGMTFNPSGAFTVKLAKLRASKTIDQLANLPINTVTSTTPDGRKTLQTVDMDHHSIIEEAIRRQIDAAMWAVKALTWGK